MGDRPPDRRTDIYGLGAVAYYMLTGRPPFLGGAAMAVMIAHARDPVTPPSRIKPDLPADLEAVVLRCLAKNPDDRYPDTRSLADALAQCGDASTWSPSLAADWWHTRAAWSLDPTSTRPPVPQSTREDDMASDVVSSADAPRIK